MKELRVAESAGFCFGVRRSVEMAEKLLAEYGACASLGELIHNEDVVRSLQEKGMRVIASPEEPSWKSRAPPSPTPPVPRSRRSIRSSAGRPRKGASC